MLYPIRGIALRSQVHALAATFVICAVACSAEASAYPSVRSLSVGHGLAVVDSPPTGASHHYRREHIYQSYRRPPFARCRYYYFPRYEWRPGCGYWWDYP